MQSNKMRPYRDNLCISPLQADRIGAQEEKAGQVQSSYFQSCAVIERDANEYVRL